MDFLRAPLQYDDTQEFSGTRSKAMREVLNKIRQVAGTRTTVLLTGETGTGKSLIAKLIHDNSNRQDGPFISVHCGAIPDTLVESELFGHEKGSFTGAVRRKLGKFELAHEGTIFRQPLPNMKNPTKHQGNTGEPSGRLSLWARGVITSHSKKGRQRAFFRKCAEVLRSPPVHHRITFLQTVYPRKGKRHLQQTPLR